MSTEIVGDSWIPEVSVLPTEMAEDAKTWSWAEFQRRFPPPAKAPQMVLDRCPKAQELRTMRRELSRDRRMPRDGKLVCMVPFDSWSDVLCFLDEHRYGCADFAMRYGSDNPLEIGRFENWTIVARDPRLS